MTSDLPYLSEQQHDKLRTLIAAIAETINPEKIFCYGIRRSERKSWSCFECEFDHHESATIDLLVITSETDKRDRQNVTNKLTAFSTAQLQLVTVVHSSNAVKQALSEGIPFFINVVANGINLLDRKRELLTPSRKPDNEFYKTDGLALANSFLKTACDCADNERNEPALFLLHQTIELSCSALVRQRLGYRSSTHSIRKLIAFTENITNDLRSIFPETTNEEIALFDTLCRAYSDVRYKQGYSVSADAVFTLIGRVQHFNDIVADLCISHTSLAAEIRKAFPLSEFETLSISIPVNVVLHKGDAPAICFDGEVELYLFNVLDKRLTLSANSPFRIKSDFKVYITYTKLSAVIVDDAATISCNESIESESFAIVQNGRGDITFDLDVTALDVTISKSGNLRLSGSAIRAMVLHTGKGNLEGKDLHVSDARVDMKGTGNVSLHIEDELHLKMLSTGKFKLKGSPRLVSFSN